MNVAKCQVLLQLFLTAGIIIILTLDRYLFHHTERYTSIRDYNNRTRYVFAAGKLIIIDSDSIAGPTTKDRVLTTV